MTIGILKEPAPETRVSLLPEAAASLTKQNITVQVEKNAGTLAYAFDEQYQTKNINALERLTVLQSDILLSIQPLSAHDVEQVKPSAILVGVYQPLFNYEIMKQCAASTLR